MAAYSSLFFVFIDVTDKLFFYFYSKSRSKFGDQFMLVDGTKMVTGDVLNLFSNFCLLISGNKYEAGTEEA